MDSKNLKRSIRLMVALSICAAASSSVFAQETRFEYILGNKPISKEAYEAFMKGREFLHSNNNADAVDMLRKAAAMIPDNPDVHNNLGIALAKTGQSSAAIEELQTALSLNQNLDASWMSLAGMYQSTGQLDKAIETYKAFLTRFPTHREYKKVAALVTGLTQERARQQALGINTQASAADDYYTEVTREGVIRWSLKQMPLKVFITPGDNVNAFRPQFIDVLKQSFESWSQASGGLIKFVFVDTAAKADIVCLWSNDPSKFKNIAESGHAVLDASRAGLVKGTITILTVPLVDQLPVTDNRMRRTCLHEVGHVLGLAGHTGNPEDAMFHTMGVADQWKDLTQRDANTIVRLYSGSETTK